MTVLMLLSVVVRVMCNCGCNVFNVMQQRGAQDEFLPVGV